MKKRILALVCAMTLAIGMSLSVSAANSGTAGDYDPGKESPKAEDTVTPPPTTTPGATTNNTNTGTTTNNTNTPTTSTPSNSGTTNVTDQNDPDEVISIANGTGQVLTGAHLAEFVRTTGISGVEGAKLGVVSNEVAKNMIVEANRVVGANAFIATIVDLQVPEGTGTATFTLTCPNVWSGQSVRILHLKSDGTYETIIPSSVVNNAVTFTMTSYSPIALVIDTTAPKTADTGLAAGLLIAILAMAGAVASAVYGRKVTE